jgi:hypothetical protein
MSHRDKVFEISRRDGAIHLGRSDTTSFEE